MFDWLQDQEALLWWAFAGSIAMFVAGLLIVPWLVVRMPHDFFLRHDQPPVYRHPILHALAVITRNAVGWPLLAAGIAMLVLPGQGLLTILVAIALIDFPGKRRVELGIVRRKPVRSLIDWLRRRKAQPSIVLPGDPDPTSPPADDGTPAGES